MLAVLVTIFPDNGSPITADALVELDDILPASAKMMPGFIQGKILNLTDEQKKSLMVARSSEITFHPTEVRYEAIIDDAETGDFRAVDTREIGV
jgi:hypothetical protein